MAVETDRALSPAQVVSWPAPTAHISMTGEKLPTPITEADETEQFLQLARDRFKLCADAEQKRRTEMLKDLQFYCGIQWDADIKAQRQDGEIKRPCLTINRIPGFVKHVVNNMRQSRPSIKIEPVGDADEEQAQIRQGLIRHIEVNSQADTSYDTAFTNMCVTGLGWMRVVDDWADPHSFDQELLVSWVSNPFSVYSDPNATQPDWSDMQFSFVVDDMTKAEFIAKYGRDGEDGKPYLAATLSNFQSIGDHASSWFPGGKIRVAEYFRIEHEKDMLYELQDGSTVLLSELREKKKDPPEEKDIKRERSCTVPVVYWSKITATDKLDERKLGGQFIPLIPVIGNQIELDGEKIIVGMVRYAREPQCLYNYMYSCFVETVALAPRNQFIAEAGQVEEFLAEWLTANIKPVAVLRYRKVMDQGQLVPAPERQSAAVDLAAFVQGLQVADQQMKAVFNIFDASLGQRGPQESGLAINARKIESDTGVYDWGDNFIRAMRHLGRVLNERLPAYYNTPGRIMQIIREDESQDAVVMNQDHEAGGVNKKFDLSDGKYAVVVSTGPTQQTRRQEAASNMIDFFKIYPAGLQACAHILVKYLDFPGKDALAAQLEKMLPAALKDPDPNAPPVPPEVQQQMAQMNEMIQQLTAALHTATDKTQQLWMKEMFETFRTEMTNETTRFTAEVKAGMEEAKALGERLFAEAERVRAATEPEFQPPSSAQPGSQPTAPTQPTVSAGPQTGGGEPSVGGG